jgi:hypothetical protein
MTAHQQLFGLTEGDAFLLIALVALPVAAFAFAMVGPALRQLGKGRFSVEFEHDLPQRALTDSAAENEDRELEIRQLVEAKAFRQAARGERPLDVEAEIEKLLDERPAPGPLSGDAGLVEEVRQLVVASNERRERRGEEPLDVEAEVARQLRELENLGQ